MNLRIRRSGPKVNGPERRGEAAGRNVPGPTLQADDRYGYEVPGPAADGIATTTTFRLTVTSRNNAPFPPPNPQSAIRNRVAFPKEIKSKAQSNPIALRKNASPPPGDTGRKSAAGVFFVGTRGSRTCRTGRRRGAVLGSHTVGGWLSVGGVISRRRRRMRRGSAAMTWIPTFWYAQRSPVSGTLPRVLKTNPPIVS